MDVHTFAFQVPTFVLKKLHTYLLAKVVIHVYPCVRSYVLK